MRKSISSSVKLVLLLLCALLALTACGGSAGGAKTTRELAERYLAALVKEDYAAVLDLLPGEVIEYGMKYLDGGREDVIEFIRYAAYDYSWLKKLPAHAEYTFEMTESDVGVMPESVKGSFLLEEDGVKLYVQEATVINLLIDAGQEEPISGSLFALKIENRWYLLSVAGDDELFVY